MSRAIRLESHGGEYQNLSISTSIRDMNAVAGGEHPSLAVLAKAPVPGQVKTRLISAIGHRAAALLHGSLLEHTLNVVETTGGAGQFWVDDVRHPFIQHLVKYSRLELRKQCSGDLGRRMAHVFQSARQPVVLVGSDCPVLTPDLLLHCANQLKKVPAVFLPAEDGGYGLIALEQFLPTLFIDIPWGSARVMSTTRARLRSLGVKWSEPHTVWDVDRPADLLRLKGQDKFKHLLDKVPVDP